MSVRIARDLTTSPSFEALHGRGASAMLSAVDERLRELAREAAGGDVEARGRWLAERLRLRAVPRRHVELAG
jgi:hypothetical protein